MLFGNVLARALGVTLAKYLSNMRSSTLEASILKRTFRLKNLQLNHQSVRKMLHSFFPGVVFDVRVARISEIHARLPRDLQYEGAALSVGDVFIEAHEVECNNSSSRIVIPEERHRAYFLQVLFETLRLSIRRLDVRIHFLARSPNLRKLTECDCANCPISLRIVFCDIHRRSCDELFAGPSCNIFWNRTSSSTPVHVYRLYSCSKLTANATCDFGKFTHVCPLFKSVCIRQEIHCEKDEKTSSALKKDVEMYFSNDFVDRVVTYRDIEILSCLAEIFSDATSTNSSVNLANDMFPEEKEKEGDSEYDLVTDVEGYDNWEEIVCGIQSESTRSSCSASSDHFCQHSLRINIPPGDLSLVYDLRMHPAPSFFQRQSSHEGDRHYVRVSFGDCLFTASSSLADEENIKGSAVIDEIIDAESPRHLRAPQFAKKSERGFMKRETHFRVASASICWSGEGENTLPSSSSFLQEYEVFCCLSSILDSEHWSAEEWISKTTRPRGANSRSPPEYKSLTSSSRYNDVALPSEVNGEIASLDALWLRNTNSCDGEIELLQLKNAFISIPGSRDNCGNSGRFSIDVVNFVPIVDRREAMRTCKIDVSIGGCRIVFSPLFLFRMLQLLNHFFDASSPSQTRTISPSIKVDACAICLPLGSLHLNPVPIYSPISVLVFSDFILQSIDRLEAHDSQNWMFPLLFRGGGQSATTIHHHHHDDDDELLAKNLPEENSINDFISFVKEKRGRAGVFNATTFVAVIADTKLVMPMKSPATTAVERRRVVLCSANRNLSFAFSKAEVNTNTTGSGDSNGIRRSCFDVVINAPQLEINLNGIDPIRELYGLVENFREPKKCGDNEDSPSPQRGFPIFSASFRCPSFKLLHAPRNFYHLLTASYICDEIDDSNEGNRSCASLLPLDDVFPTLLLFLTNVRFQFISDSAAGEEREFKVKTCFETKRSIFHLPMLSPHCLVLSVSPLQLQPGATVQGVVSSMRMHTSLEVQNIHAGIILNRESICLDNSTQLRDHFFRLDFTSQVVIQCSNLVVFSNCRGRPYLADEESFLPFISAFFSIEDCPTGIFRLSFPSQPLAGERDVQREEARMLRQLDELRNANIFKENLLSDLRQQLLDCENIISEQKKVLELYHNDDEVSVSVLKTESEQSHIRPKLKIPSRLLGKKRWVKRRKKKVEEEEEGKEDSRRRISVDEHAVVDIATQVWAA